MKYIIFFFLLLSNVHAYYDGNSFFRCHNFVMEKPHDLSERDLVFCTFNAGFITGAIQSILNDNPTKYFIPQNITSAKLVQMTLDYYVEHPQIMNYELHKVVKLMMIENFYVK